jgi:hypothetical protein
MRWMNDKDISGTCPPGRGDAAFEPEARARFSDGVDGFDEIASVLRCVGGRALARIRSRSWSISPSRDSSTSMTGDSAKDGARLSRGLPSSAEGALTGRILRLLRSADASIS